jgi:hypothetical protein
MAFGVAIGKGRSETGLAKPLTETAPDPFQPASVAETTVGAIVAEYRTNEFAAAAKFENPRQSISACLLQSPLSGLGGCRAVDVSGRIDDLGRDDRVMPTSGCLPQMGPQEFALSFKTSVWRRLRF